ncbi:cadherin repeat domain-containing protein [Blastomonas aquatica]|uniref:Cadherin domain-containing protein n=1 Tax=Blastomonas aquatica TaxID=1510276 RepID=A0ABQ1JAA2_9SPHN|nr:cadherin repeat domain-containing protein [Blastomonas aquatica]GGB61478.1 hypothetical protein GCM10010833_15590 [Blastomonas aquatica]
MKSVVAVSRAVLVTVLCAVPLIVSACGGGGTPTPTPPTSLPPTNRAPQFTSPATASIVENSATTFYTAAASDPDGDPLTFSISGGPDAAVFALTGTNLAFRNAPDFERPADSDRDNVYNVTLTVSDGRGGTNNLSVVITVTNEKEGIVVRRIATGFVEPIGGSLLVPLLPPQNGTTGQVAVAQANGEIYAVDGTTGQRSLFTDVFANRPRGRVLAISPFGRSTGLFTGMLAVAQDPSGRVVVQGLGNRNFPNFTVILPAGSPPVSAKIFEGPAGQQSVGNLFMAISDESGDFAQNANSMRGKLLRLGLNDPYAGAAVSPGFIPQIVGNGIRHSGGGGAFAGQILLADQGASVEHELTFFDTNARGLNFGWPGREGTQGVGSNAPASVNGPKLVYGFGNGRDEGTGIIFGGLYQGPIATLNNRFVFGDRSGTIWSVPANDLTNSSLLRAPQLDRRTEDFVPDIGRIESPVAFIVDDRNRLFILDADGELFRVDAG